MQRGRKLPQGNISTSNRKVHIKTHSKANTIGIHSITLINKNHTNSGNKTSGMSITSFMKMLNDRIRTAREAIRTVEMNAKVNL